VAPRRAGRRTPLLLLVLALSLFCAGLAALTSRLFLSPASDRPWTADAVVVLSGDFGDRLAKALELMEGGVAPTLVIDGDPDYALMADLCVTEQRYEVVCLRPNPDSTRAEARALGRLASDRGWRRVVVVTSRQHVTRAGLLFGRCVRGTVAMVASDPRHPPRATARAILHEVPALAAAVLRDRTC
jgi:uncharacterized SAM-binding protein YcdF (DUF218 family)